jgi:nucleotide-binding universal stress UspA family protein
MLKGVLVGINGTDYSRSAGDFAIDLARQRRCEIAALGVVDVPGVTTGQSVPLGGAAYKEERDAAILAEAGRLTAQALREFSDRCGAAGLACCVTRIDGDPAAELTRAAQAADLLIIGQRTHSATDRLYHPSDVLASVVTHAPGPVAVAPRSGQAGRAVVIAWDGSAQAARAMHQFRSLGLAADREIHLVAVDPDRQAMETAARRAASYLAMHRLQFQTHLLEESAPGPAIRRVAQAVEAGWIVLGAYGKPWTARMVFGSVTRDLLEHSRVPLFLTA